MTAVFICNNGAVETKIIIIPRSCFMMILRLTPYLMIGGNTNEAEHFYEKALDAKVLTRLTYGEKSENAKKLMPHAMPFKKENKLPCNAQVRCNL
jgi:branched-subunit amino acid transport protein AzlD